MKICKSALDATVEEFNHVGFDEEAAKETVKAIIQAYSERLPDLVGVISHLLADFSETYRTLGYNPKDSVSAIKATELLAAMEQ